MTAAEALAELVRLGVASAQDLEQWKLESAREDDKRRSAQIATRRAAHLNDSKNPRDLSAVFGGITLGPDSFPTIYLHDSEVELRRSLASVAYAYGWDVQEEVVIPGWGRIDIVISAAGETYLIELKIDLTKPARIRKAFQQVDGYGRWWAENRGMATDVFLVGSKIDDQAIDPVARAYPSVGPKSMGHLISFLEHGSLSQSAKYSRALASQNRASRADRIYEFHRKAADRLALLAVGRDGDEQIRKRKAESLGVDLEDVPS